MEEKEKKRKFKKIYIEITNICNLHCTFCPDTTRKKEYMEVKSFEHILNQVKDYTDLICLHIKGEPLLHPQLEEILNECTKANLMVNITTNATTLKDKVDILKNSPALRQLNLSIHCMNQNNINKDEYLNDIFESVRRIRERRGRKDIYISYRLWEYNKCNNNEYIFSKLEKEYGIHSLQEQAKKNEWVELDENVFLNQDVEFKWPDIYKEEVNTNGTCYGLRGQIGILVDGTVVPCCLDQEGDIKLGNILKENLEDILNKQECKDMVNGFENNKLIHKLCKTCGYIQRFKGSNCG